MANRQTPTTGEQRKMPVRPYGIEIESPEVAAVIRTLQDANFGLTIDGSVTSPDCECDCDSCEHSCNCEHCSITNGYDDPEHCGDCQANECQTPIQYEPQLTERVRRALVELHDINSEDLENGGHIHINAPDLTAKQGGLLQTVWFRVAELYAELIGREPNGYCELRTPAKNYGEQFDGERMNAVNLTNVARFWNGEGVNDYNHNGTQDTSRKWTVEFRQFASTADPEIIERRAQLCRALVDYIISGGAPYWILRAETAEELAEVIDLANH